jgi:threonine dehydrogenase-like Zn-dependent dehydrogenase
LAGLTTCGSKPASFESFRLTAVPKPVSALRQIILSTRKGGRISVPGVYGGIADKFPIGALMEKGLTIKSGQTHVQKYMPKLLDLILEGKIDTTFLISHRLDLEDAALGYLSFKEKQNEYTKVVLKPRHTRH